MSAFYVIFLQVSSINRVLRSIGTQPGGKEMNPYMLEKYGILNSPDWARNAPWYTNGGGGGGEYESYGPIAEEAPPADTDKKGRESCREGVTFMVLI